MLGKVQFMSRRTYLSTVLSTPMPDHWGYSRSMFLECAADGVLLFFSLGTLKDSIFAMNIH